MTNRQIVWEESQRLLAAGKIKPTGRVYNWTDEEGMEHTYVEPEPIHTFAAWKELGYVVRKGEKAVAKFPIWKYAAKKVEKDDGTEEDRSSMFMKMSAFFSESQVEKLVNEEAM